MTKFTLGVLALASAALLAACGGGGADTTPRATVTSVKVFGDSLQDGGTFPNAADPTGPGIKFTVEYKTSRIFAERVADSFGVATPCPFYKFNGTTFVANPVAGCTNFAIGGGVINYRSAGATTPAAAPLAVVNQLTTAAAATPFTPNDLLIIDGGGNDGAALVTAFLGVMRALSTPANVPAAFGNYQTLIGDYLTVDQKTKLGTDFQAAAATGNVPGIVSALGTAGGQYMTALGTAFGGQADDLAVKKGATRVVLLNMPAILQTPRFQMVLASLGSNRATFEPIFDQWIQAFNGALAARVGTLQAIALVDFYTAFNEQIANPAQFGLSEVRTPVCPILGLGSDGLPEYGLSQGKCTAAAAATVNANWQTAAFSDGFHPTPYGHQLVAQLISRSVAQKGWL